ncbi:S41 family peptidase [Nonomuraea typhae]|uniref:S41 family peptidase n=1 Tax=Nonomuraea typhae TaxID=2603600 RepID=A0ABW7YU94_9ACTN
MIARSVTTGLALLLAVSCTTAPPRAQPGKPPQAAGCTQPKPGAGPPPPETPTTIDVVEQAYQCILTAYYGAATLDHRTLLSAGFAALTRQLNRDGRDLPDATMPALTGDRQTDWAAFETVYRRLTDRLPDLREKLAVVTLEAIVAALDDNHARWTYGGGERPPGYYDGDQYGLGLKASLGRQATPGAALPPLFVTAITGGAAEAAGLRPGDVIASINGSPPFTGGTLTPAALAALYPRYPEADPVTLRLHRRDGDRRWSVRLKPGLFQPDPDTAQTVSGTVLDKTTAHVRLAGFAPDSADRVFKTVARLGTGKKLTGVVLDLRGNGGGSPEEATRLVSGFAHGKVTAYQCAADGACETMRTDDSVPLLNLPLVVLVDRACASACEHFSSAIKDHRVGPLVGTRTAGVISGPAQPYLLSNYTSLGFPSKHHLAPDREVIDRVGVAPDHHVPLTAADAAAGRDPALAKALTLLRAPA